MDGRGPGLLSSNVRFSKGCAGMEGAVGPSYAVWSLQCASG